MMTIRFKQIKKTIKRTWKNPKSRMGIFAGSFAIIGIVLLFSSRAATFSISVEPENGNTTGSTMVVDDPTTAGSKAVRFGTVSSNGAYSDSNQPWALKAGESVTDNVPTNVAIKNYADFTNNGTRNFKDTMDAIRAGANAPYYVRMPAGTFHISSFPYGSDYAGYGAGYQDVSAQKYFAGIIGAGADKTIIVIDPNSMSSTQVNAVAAGNPNPVQIKAIYIGGSSVPTVFSGLTFRGSFQQTTTLNDISGTAPAPYQGLYITDTRAGSIIQYSRFQGFGFTAKSSPPYETGAIASLHAAYTIRRTEVDGRLAKEINSSQPVASGGVMWNYETGEVKAIDSWLHHTRRSGWAIHDHAPTEGSNTNDQGAYYGENFQIDNVSNTTDSLAGTELGFPPSNVEEVANSMIYVRPRFNLSNPIYGTRAHIIVATSYGNKMAKTFTISDPVIADTERGGCLIIRVLKQPNYLGISPYYTAWQSGGAAATPIKVTKNGKALIPVLIGDYNASVHTPDKYYVVIMG